LGRGSPDSVPKLLDATYGSRKSVSTTQWQNPGEYTVNSLHCETLKVRPVFSLASAIGIS
jgi:hypothetical protein